MIQLVNLKVEIDELHQNLCKICPKFRIKNPPNDNVIG